MQSNDYIIGLGNNGPDEPRIFGRPPSGLLHAYLSLAHHEFMTFARSSPDSWMLVDCNKGFFITSPEFSGAYWDRDLNNISSNLSALLAARKKKNLQLVNPSSREWSVSKHCKVTALALPHVTPFAGIQMLSAWCFHDNKCGLKTYLPPGADRIGRNEFSEAMLKSAHDLAERKCDEIILPFSGGKDCLAVFLALRAAGLESRVKCFYIDHLFAGGDRSQAIAVAKAYKIDLSIKSPVGGWVYGTSDGADRLEELLGTHLSNPATIQHILTDEGSLIVDGQNMDALLSFHMQKPAQQSSRLIINKQQLFYFLANLKYVIASKKIDENWSFEAYQMLINAFNWLQNLRGRAELGEVKSARISDHFAADALLEIPAADERAMTVFKKDLCSVMGMFSGEASLREAFYYYYPSWQVVLGSTVPNAQVIRFPNARAFASLWMAPLRMRDLHSPKWQIYDFLRNHSAVSYNDVRFRPDEDNGLRKNMNLDFLKSHGAKLNIETPILDNVTQDAKDGLKADFDGLFNRIDNERYSAFDLIWALRVINFDLLLRRHG